MHDHNYSSIMSPIDYMPIFISLFATSNLVDSKDIIEDKTNHINTIPVLLGEKTSNSISVLALLLAGICFAINPHFNDRPVVNWIYELQTFASGAYPILNNTTNIKVSTPLV